MKDPFFLSPHEYWCWVRALWQHGRAARMTREQLLALQERKFRRLVRHAHRHSPYYRGLMRRLRLDPAACRPEDFPPIDKHDVLEHFDALVTDRDVTLAGVQAFLDRSPDPRELYLGRYHVLHTSGTSGTMGCFLYSNADWIQGSSVAARMYPPRQFRKRVAGLDSMWRNYGSVKLTLNGRRGTHRLLYNIRLFDMGVPLERMVAELNRFQPDLLTGFSGMIRLLAEAQERGELNIHPREISNGGETLWPQDKAYIERIFGVRVDNLYASTECLYMGLTLEGDALCLMEDELIFELRDDHILVTNLFNRTMPLIRYRINDALSPCEDFSPAHPFRRVSSVIGRREQNLVLRNRRGIEESIHWSILEEFYVEIMSACQFVREDLETLRVRVRYQAGASSERKRAAERHIAGRLNAVLADKHMHNVRFRIEETPDLAPDPRTGKFPRVVEWSPDAPSSNLPLEPFAEPLSLE